MTPVPRAAARWAGLAAAIVLLNLVLTFHNVWPTLGVRLAEPLPELSAELAIVLLVVLAWASRGSRIPGALPATLAAAWLALAVARYFEVTAPALYGRPVNLYWDLRHVGNLLGMVATVAGPAVSIAGIIALALALAAMLAAMHVAWRRVVHAAAVPGERLAVGVVAGGAAALWIAGLTGLPYPAALPRFSTPVTATYARQARLLAHAALEAGSNATAEAADPPAGPAGDALASGGPVTTLDALGDDDVLFVFLESYGEVTYTNPALATRLAADRARFAAAIAATGRAAVSATIVAPTFGGNSWLSHLSVLSGREVRDPDTYARVMQRAQPTLVSDFARAGYRTIALMPGLRQAWPEGAFYGFDALLGADALDYRGPGFGWWRIPDQYALARLDAVERDGRPRFVFFPTISSHAPFRPTPPYQPDWSRFGGAAPFGPEAAAAIAVAPQWTDLAPGYGDGIAYAMQWLAGYLERHADSDLTLVILGDHQPPAAVSGPGSNWHVPMHVVTRRAAVQNALLADGFVAGLEPAREPVLPMAALRPLLTGAFAGGGAVKMQRARHVEPARGTGAAAEPASQRR